MIGTRPRPSSRNRSERGLDGASDEAIRKAAEKVVRALSRFFVPRERHQGVDRERFSLFRQNATGKARSVLGERGEEVRESGAAMGMAKKFKEVQQRAEKHCLLTQ